MNEFDPDVVGRYLSDMAVVARGMAPSWEATGMSFPVLGTEGEVIGDMLPGRGIYLNHDLARVGIRRRIRGVFDRSPVWRLIDRLNGDEVGAITSMDDVLTARDAGKGEDSTFIVASPPSSAGYVNTAFQDMFFHGTNDGVQTGTYPSTTAPTDSVCTRATTGAIKSITNPPSGSKYLIALGLGQNLSAGIASFSTYMAILCDQLLMAGKFRTTVTTAETIASPSTITRQYGPTSHLGTGAQLLAVGQTVRASASTSNNTISYKNHLGNSSSTTYAHDAQLNPPGQVYGAGTLLPFIPLASGDIGIRSITSAQKAASADAAGSGAYALEIVQPLACIPGMFNSHLEDDFILHIEGLIPLPVDGSGVLGCYKVLHLNHQIGSPNEPPGMGMLRTVYG